AVRPAGRAARGAPREPRDRRDRSPRAGRRRRARVVPGPAGDRPRQFAGDRAFQRRDRGVPCRGRPARGGLRPGPRGLGHSGAPDAGVRRCLGAHHPPVPGLGIRHGAPRPGAGGPSPGDPREPLYRHHPRAIASGDFRGTGGDRMGGPSPDAPRRRSRPAARAASKLEWTYRGRSQSMKSRPASKPVANRRTTGERYYRTSAWDEAGPLEMLSARFALQALLSLGPRFNLRRDINNVVVLAGRYFVWPEPVLARLRDFLGRRCSDLPAWEGVGKVSLDELMSRFGGWNGLYDDVSIYYYLDEFVKLHAKELLGVFQATIAEFDARLARRRIRLVENIDMLSGVLGLTDAARSVLLHASLCKYQRDLRPILVDCKAQSAQEAYGMLGQVLGHDASAIAEALRAGGRLDSLGLIEPPIAEHSITDLGDLMRVSDKLLAVLTAEYRSESSMMAAFTRPAGESSLGLVDFPHVEADARYLVALLGAAVASEERGVYDLLYRPPGTGKTEFAQLVCWPAGLELYLVACLGGDGNSLSPRER